MRGDLAGEERRERAQARPREGAISDRKEREAWSRCPPQEPRELAPRREVVREAPGFLRAGVGGQRGLQPVRVDQKDRLVAEGRERERRPERGRGRAFPGEGARETDAAEAARVDAAGEALEDARELSRSRHRSAARDPAPASSKAIRASSARRSEERRVGKECRSRWSPYH